MTLVISGWPTRIDTDAEANAFVSNAHPSGFAIFQPTVSPTGFANVRRWSLLPVVERNVIANVTAGPVDRLPVGSAGHLVPRVMTLEVQRDTIDGAFAYDVRLDWAWLWWSGAYGAFDDEHDTDKNWTAHILAVNRGSVNEGGAGVNVAMSIRMVTYANGTRGTGTDNEILSQGVRSGVAHKLLGFEQSDNTQVYTEGNASWWWSLMGVSGSNVVVALGFAENSLGAPDVGAFNWSGGIYAPRSSLAVNRINAAGAVSQPSLRSGGNVYVGVPTFNIPVSVSAAVSKSTGSRIRDVSIGGIASVDGGNAYLEGDAPVSVSTGFIPVLNS